MTMPDRIRPATRAAISMSPQEASKNQRCHCAIVGTQRSFWTCRYGREGHIAVVALPATYRDTLHPHVMHTVMHLFHLAANLLDITATYGQSNIARLYGVTCLFFLCDWGNEGSETMRLCLARGGGAKAEVLLSARSQRDCIFWRRWWKNKYGDSNHNILSLL